MEGSHRGSDSGVADAVMAKAEVEDVGGYMGWLYGERGRKV